jgi:heterodisulfide reductase subunit B
MKCTYYPGCSQHSTARGYEESIQTVAKPLDLELETLDDWNCCGATAYMSVNEVLSFCLTARNLSLAAKAGHPVVTPCNACFTNLRKTNAYMAEFPEVKAKVDEALGAGGMAYDGKTPTKHLLQVIVEDVGLEKIRGLVKRPLAGLRVAPYYGCQIVRPLGIEGGTDNPMMLDHLLEALGATPTHFPMKTTCCGGSLMGTQEDVALRLCRNLLLCAEQAKADCIAVTCSLCQMNLDAYQQRINSNYGTHFNFPIVYFTQLMGLALGFEERQLGLQRGVVPTSSLVRRGATAGAKEASS